MSSRAPERSMPSRKPEAGPATPELASTALVSTAVAAVAGPRRPGRPRSEAAEQAILAAALDLFAECGPEALGIEQVAARAGVGKATIYRRWPGKEEMLMEAVSSLATELPVPQGRSVRADLTALLEAVCRDVADPRRARLFALMQGEGKRSPRLMARYAGTVLRPRQDAMSAVLRR